MLVPRQAGCFTAILHFFKSRKHQKPDAASEAPDTFSIFPTSLPPVEGPRSRDSKERARPARLALSKVERARTCLADDDDTEDGDDELRSVSTEASASRSARSHSSSLSTLSPLSKEDSPRSKKIIFQEVVNVVEYDAGDKGEWQKNETVVGPAAVPDSCSEMAVCRPGSAEASRDDCDERCVAEAFEWVRSGCTEEGSYHGIGRGGQEAEQRPDEGVDEVVSVESPDAARLEGLQVSDWATFLGSCLCFLSALTSSARLSGADSVIRWSPE
ncbi:hypothetical protein FOZ63_009462, partial [Perkinsus olseni]